MLTLYRACRPAATGTYDALAPLSSAADADSSAGPALVVTTGVLQTVSLMSPWLRANQPVLLVGPEGCGKAVLLEQCFAEMPVRWCICTLNLLC